MHGLQACMCLISLGLLWSGESFACASCGSGGDDPLVLYPNEATKFYLGVTQLRNLQTLDSRGEVSSLDDERQRMIHTLAVGQRWRPDFFATGSLNYWRNSSNDRSRDQWSDPRFSLHWIPLLQSLDEPWKPQWKLVFSFKPGLSPGIQESRDRQQLDVFGSGFDEYSLVTDIWYGMSTWKWGLAQSYVYVAPKRLQGEQLQNGYRARSTLNLGTNYSQRGRIVAGLLREYQGASKYEGVSNRGSEVINYAFFLTFDFRLRPQSLVTLTLSDRGRIFRNRNGIRSTSWTLALSQVLKGV